MKTNSPPFPKEHCNVCTDSHPSSELSTGYFKYTVFQRLFRFYKILHLQWQCIQSLTNRQCHQQLLLCGIRGENVPHVIDSLASGQVHALVWLQAAAPQSWHCREPDDYLCTQDMYMTLLLKLFLLFFKVSHLSKSCIELFFFFQKTGLFSYLKNCAVSKWH